MKNERFGLGAHCPYIALKISGGLSATGVRPIVSMELLSLALVTSRVRKTEKVAFGSVPASTSYLSSKKLRMAAKMSKSLGKSLHAAASPTSYQLSVEDEDLQKRKEQYRVALAKIIEEKPDAVGYAFAINGEINTADAYGSGILFRKLWNKLLDAAALEAIAESHRKSEKPAPPVTADSIRSGSARRSRARFPTGRKSRRGCAWIPGAAKRPSCSTPATTPSTTRSCTATW